MAGDGAVAQLVERLAGSQKAARSSRVSSTFAIPDIAALGFTLGGFVSGEGCFMISRKLPPFKDGSDRLKFVFQVTAATRDRRLLEALKSFLGYGSIQDVPARRSDYQPMSAFTIASLVGHHSATIPFAELFLIPSAKRRQFERWRQAMESYEKQHPLKRGRSICSLPGCERPVRGRGLCRSHYYQVTGY
jgi:hypothetical protein